MDMEGAAVEGRVLIEGKKMGKKFDTLARRVEREYEAKGVSHKTAALWGKETAGKVYREQQAAAKHHCRHCNTMHHVGDGLHTCSGCGWPCVT